MAAIETAALRGARIAAIEKSVQIDVLRTALDRQLHHGMNVFFVAVHATRGQQADDMHRLVGADGLVDGIGQRRIGEKRPGLD